MDDDTLMDFFSSFNPKRVKVATRKNGRSKGFGFLEFETRSQVDAVLLQSFSLDGREFLVQRSVSSIDQSSDAKGSSSPTAKQSVAEGEIPSGLHFVEECCRSTFCV